MFSVDFIMAQATLMVFLLDNIPGFSEMLNATFEVLHKTNPHESFIRSPFCDPTVAEPILHIVDKQLHHHDPTPKTSFYAPLDSQPYEETLNSFDLTNESSSFEESAKTSNKSSIASNLEKLLQQDPKYLVDLHYHRVPAIKKQKSFPQSAPFLVAIFETLSNVTAQTCAGALLSPLWALTTANCIEVLEDLDVNSNKTAKNTYMIVAGATNPYKDGTIHNVTEIYLFPEKTVYKPDNGIRATKDKELDRQRTRNSSTIVLMKMDTPVVNVSIVKIATEEVSDHAKVKVWGWSSAHIAGSNMTTPAATAARAAASLGAVRLCDWNVTGAAGATRAPAFCLDVAADNRTLSNGAPIVVMEGSEARLLALRREPDEALVAPLTNVTSWVDHLMLDLETMKALVDS